MSNEIVTRTNEQKELIKKQFGLTKVTDLEVEFFFATAEKLQLDPLSKQIYAIPYFDKKSGTHKLTIIASIDGARAVAARQGTYAGCDVPTFGWNGDKLDSATFTVYKIVKGVRCPFTAIVYMSEYNTGKNVWADKPRTMLAKCAEMAALRKAFPMLGKVYDEAEIDQESLIDVLAIESNDTVSSEQHDVLFALSMAMKPDQDESIARTRTAKTSADDYADYAVLGIDTLVKQGTIYDKHGVELKDAILNGDSGVVAMIQDAIEGANNEA